MAEYIDREKMLKYIEENNTADEWIVGQYNADWIYSFIESQPTADVVEVIHGKWDYIATHDCFSCNICKFDSDVPMKYCGGCGAIMDGERK